MRWCAKAAFVSSRAATAFAVPAVTHPESCIFVPRPQDSKLEGELQGKRRPHCEQLSAPPLKLLVRLENLLCLRRKVSQALLTFKQQICCLVLPPTRTCPEA
ncbi:unnamed protein product [Ostreobium quekettii]|uniref:Secreted protein n=1 Tax=Ostreobium quekettii TaxID=121088 RepID=A0A8S1JCN2_9CHLO|nr:unnamed protein product [Ostreobium quekettii]